MGNTADQTLGPNTITVTYSGSGANWDSQTSFPAGLRIAGIGFVASNAADVLKIRNTSSTPPVYVATGSKYDFLFGVDWKPYILLTDQSFNTIGNVSITFFLK